jgi:hypothetical protein
MKDKHYDAWQDAKTQGERITAAAEHIRYLDEKIVVAFEFLAAFGYGGPEISHHNMDNVKEDFSGPLQAVIQGDEWLEITPKDF